LRNIFGSFVQIFADTKPSATAEVKGLAGLALGFILVGTADHEAAGDMLSYLHDDNVDITDSNNRFVALGIALIFLGKIIFCGMCSNLSTWLYFSGTQDRSEVFIESVRALPEPFGSMTSTLIDVCAYAGTGNVLKIQVHFSYNYLKRT
jgi:26S proteasome regulatory subunit N1